MGFNKIVRLDHESDHCDNERGSEICSSCPNWRIWSFVKGYGKDPDMLQLCWLDVREYPSIIETKLRMLKE